MLRLHHLLLLAMLSMDGGSVDGASVVDGGNTVSKKPTVSEPDAGVSSSLPKANSGVGRLQPVAAGGFHWPEEVRTLATLDGPAVLAAHAALQDLLARLAKQGLPKSCGYSAKAMEVIVGEGDGMYIVLINQRMDKCGWQVPPGYSTDMDWFEQYAVSPEGKLLAHYPYAL